jgi:hypothetical protein
MNNLRADANNVCTDMNVNGNTVTYYDLNYIKLVNREYIARI